MSSAPNKNSDFDLTDVTNDHWKKRVECHWVVCHAHSEVFSRDESTDIGMIRKVEDMCDKFITVPLHWTLILTNFFSHQADVATSQNKHIKICLCVNS